MKTPKHTKGPWDVVKYPKVFSIVSESKRQIAIMTEHYGDCPEIPMSQFERSEQDKADAHLIAAAPEMLEALIAGLSCIDQHTDCPVVGPIIEQMQRAIKKARGEK